MRAHNHALQVSTRIIPWLHRTNLIGGGAGIFKKTHHQVGIFEGLRRHCRCGSLKVFECLFIFCRPHEVLSAATSPRALQLEPRRENRLIRMTFSRAIETVKIKPICWSMWDTCRRPKYAPPTWPKMRSTLSGTVTSTWSSYLYPDGPYMSIAPAPFLHSTFGFGESALVATIRTATRCSSSNNS